MTWLGRTHTRWDPRPLKGDGVRTCGTHAHHAGQAPRRLAATLLQGPTAHHGHILPWDYQLGGGWTDTDPDGRGLCPLGWKGPDASSLGVS